MNIQVIDLGRPSEDGKQYYEYCLIAKNKQLKDLKLTDQFEVLLFTNFSCNAVIDDYMVDRYGLHPWDSYKYYKTFFHGTSKDINLDYIYKKYHKFFTFEKSQVQYI